MNERARIIEAYLQMAESAHYRPAAPGDGCGNVTLTKAELRDRSLLSSEAERYAEDFIEEENQHRFWIGVSWGSLA